MVHTREGDVVRMGEDQPVGKVKGGLFLRSSLLQDIQRIEKQNDLRVVGIKMDPDDKWNMEFIVEEKPSAEIVNLRVVT
jgi:hypothetical protein